MCEKTKINVAYIVTPISFGGAEKVNLNFLKTVDRRRFDITLVLLLRPWEEPPIFAQEVVKLGYEYITLPVSIKQGGDPFRVPRVAWRLSKLLRAGKFDLVHTHGYFADICAIPWARLLGIKTITTCHGFIANNTKLKLYNSLNIYAIKLSYNVIAVSAGIRDQLVFAGVGPQKIRVIPNAVETDFDAIEIATLRNSKRRELHINDSEFVIGFLGRLSAEKGANFLIDAVAQLADEGLPLRLLIIGDGPEREELENLARTKGVHVNTVFTGFQKDPEAWLPAFDIFFLPSLTEGTPLALLEAMAMGIPSIASAVGGIPNIVKDRENGLLVPPADISANKIAIQTLIRDVALRKRLSKLGVHTLKTRFGIENWCQAIEGCYLKLCG